MTQRTHETNGLKLVDYVRELTEQHSHAEKYSVRQGARWFPKTHHTKVPSLLNQLWSNDIPSAASEEGPRPGFASSPAARLDALDAAVRIDLEANRWITDLGERARRTDTADTIHQLHGLSASADPVTRHAIERDVRRWWTQARIVTGWDSPAWTPDNTCPQCGERGTLKVKLADHIGMCTNDACRVTWDEASIGLLADHIRAESSAERKPRVGAGPCWCPWPMPMVPDLSRLCPRCGSVRCHHALGLRLLDTLRVQQGA
jgi:hypothetical protein